MSSKQVSQTEDSAKRAGMKAYLDSLGCKLNQAEIESIGRQFIEAGHEITGNISKADVYVLNTCTVTHIADRKSRQRLRMANRRNPGALIVATGCYAQGTPEELDSIEGIGLILGNADKMRMVEILREKGYLNGPDRRKNGNNARTRSFIKVQDGCNKFCSYCIVPLVRGREKSLPVEMVLDEVEKRVTEGYSELVLTGTEIGSYDYNNVGLDGLLRRILAETNVSRIRLSSLQPEEISPEFIWLWRNRRLCHHFHLSLQSGCDEVLVRMKRRYSINDYKRIIDIIRMMIPDAAITTDIIIGFPGETEEEFEQSYDFCQQMDFARIHVFNYSVRRGTEAARMPDQVSDKLKKERSQRMLELAKESSDNFNRRFIGSEMEVLFEQKTGGVWSGLTGNYVRVYTTSDDDLTGKLIPVKVVERRGDGVWGETVN